MKVTVIAEKCSKNCNVQHKFKFCVCKCLRYLSRFLFICAIYIVFNVGSTVSKEPFMNSSVTEKPAIMHWPKLKTKLYCHYSIENDALASADDPSFSPGNNSIFFHETSCRGGINSREACAVESAARLHPKRQINLLFSSPITDTMLRNSSLMKLLEFSNVKLSRVHVQEYGKGTVVEKILSKNLKNSFHPIEHASDILRIVTLHKYGGLYLDTDSILVKNLDSLPPNWIAKESGNDIASGIMAFSKDAIGSSVTKDILMEIRNTYKPKGWSVNGPKAIQRVLKRLCPRTLTKSDHCKGVKIFPPESFYPVPYKQHRSYFKNGTISNIEKAHMHHMWNFLTRNLVIEKGSPFARIARKVCPTIYKMYGDEFGK